MTQKSPSENGHYNASTSVGSSGNSNATSEGATKPKDEIEAVARELKEEVAHIAKDFAGEAKKAAETKVGAGKDFAAEQLGSVADALRKTSKHLQLSDSPVTDYVEKAASSVEGISHYFQTRTISQLIGDVERYARREPAVFLGGAFFAGVLGGRFLKAATPAPNGNQTQQGSRSSRALPANTSSSDDTSRRQNQNHGKGDRHEQRGGMSQGQGQVRSENKSVSTGNAGGGSSANDGTKSPAGAGATSGKADDATNRSGKGSGVS